MNIDRVGTIYDKSLNCMYVVSGVSSVSEILNNFIRTKIHDIGSEIYVVFLIRDLYGIVQSSTGRYILVDDNHLNFDNFDELWECGQI